MNKLQNHKYILTILIILFNVSEFIGAIDRFNSSNVDSYLDSVLGHVDNVTAGFVGLIPIVDTVFTIILSLLIVLIYTITPRVINSKRMPTIIKGFTLFMWMIGTILSGTLIFGDIRDSLQWQFYLLLIPSVLQIFILIIMLRNIFYSFKYTQQ